MSHSPKNVVVTERIFSMIMAGKSFLSDPIPRNHIFIFYILMERYSFLLSRFPIHQQHLAAIKHSSAFGIVLVQY